MPIFNVDGVAFIEKNWLETGKFMDDRKNMMRYMVPAINQVVEVWILELTLIGISLSILAR